MGAVFAIFAGFYYWVAKMTGFTYTEILGKIHFVVFFIGVNVTFFPMHFLLRHGGLWFYFSYKFIFIYVSTGTLAQHPADTGCIVGQRTKDVGPTKCTITQVILLSELPQDARLTRVNLHFKIPSRISNRIYFVIGTCNTLVLRCKGRLKYSSSEYRRDLNIDIMARFCESKSSDQSGNPEWASYIDTLNQLRWYLYKEIYTWTNKVTIQVKFISIGGKIAKKANALSNVWDNAVINLYNNKNGNMGSVKRRHYYKNIFNKNIVKGRPYLWKNNNRLNLVMLDIRLNKVRRVRNFSTTSKSSDWVLKQVGETSFGWPKRWNSIEDRVFDKQCRLSKLAVDNGLKGLPVQNYQNFLIASLDFRLIAIRKVRGNKGSKTAGVDQVILTNDEEWLNLVEELRNLKNYKSKPVRRLYIPKKHDKMRPLGIPTIFDRAVQSLFKLVTQPITEAFADPNSYGFRKNRNAHQALAKLRAILASKPGAENIVILNLDIKGFFDNIKHEWILENYPISVKYKHVLHSWLISGVLTNYNLETTNSGVPQGGIISPVISNFVLDGLEKCVEGSIAKITKSKSRVKEYYGTKSGKPVVKKFNIQFVRYADDFVITCRSIYIAKDYIKPAAVTFLKEIGVWLSEEKSSIFRLRNKNLDFLGYSFVFSKAWKPNGMFKGKSGKPGIALMPLQRNFKEICKKIRDKFHYGLNSSAYTLIAKVNPIISGWCHYIKYGQSNSYRKKLEFYLYKLCWKWARRKHRKWGRKRIASTYFLRPHRARFKGRVWAFRGQTVNNSRYKDNDSGKSIYLVNPIADIETLSMFKGKLKNKFKHIHAYHEKVKDVEEFINKQLINNKWKHKSLKEKLFKTQKGVCSYCHKTIELDKEDT